MKLMKDSPKGSGMRRWFGLVITLALVSPCWAVTNSVTVNNISGGAISSQPVTISRFFVQGEIPKFPRPSVGGVPLSQWQANVMTRWRDGSGVCAITVATNATPIVVTCGAPHGFLDGEIVTVTGAAGNTAANGTWTVWAPASNKLTLLNSAGNGTYTNGGSAAGPADGSVKHALITFAISIVSGGGQDVLFANDLNPCHLGDQVTCDAAAFTQAQMLSFDTSATSWGAAMRVTSNAVSVTTDARTMLGAGAWRYWLKGPLLTQAILEDRTTARAYDFGFKDRYTTVLSLNGGISPTATSVGVIDASEIAALPLPTTIQVDSEQMSVTAVNTNTLTVTRGFNSTTAATHTTTRLVRILGLAGTDPNGWRKRPGILLNTQAVNGTLSATATTFQVYTPEILTNLGFPYHMTIDNEEIVVCGWDGQNVPGVIRIGVSACPNIDGRGVNGTTATTHKSNTQMFAKPFDSLWQAAPSAKYKSIHPIFLVSFYAGWAGVKVKYGLEIPWVDRLQDQFISVDLLSGPSNATTERSVPAFVFAATQRWQDEYWYGLAPSATAIDFNLAYMASSGALMNYDTSRGLDATTLNTELTAITANGGGVGIHYGPGLTGRFSTDMTTAGGRSDIGPLTTWNMTYLYQMSNTSANPALFTNLMSELNIYGNAPVHFRESVTGQPFDLWNSTDAFGHWISPNARTSRMFGEDDGNSSQPIAPVGFASSFTRIGVAARYMTNWNLDIAHQTTSPYVHYLVTGDWWILEELMAWGSFDLMYTGAGTARGSRHNDWGLVTSADDETRGIAWATKNIAVAGVSAPTSMVEHTWFNEKLANNIAIREGVINLVGGRFYEPYSTGKWYWGRNTQASGGPDPLRWLGVGSSTAPIFGGGNNCTGPANLNDRIFDPWMDNFNYAVWGWMTDMGFTFSRTLLSEALKKNIEMILDPLFAPKHHLAAECLAVNAYPSMAAFTSWDQVIAEQGADSYTGDLARWNAGCAQDPNFAYACVFLAVMTFAPGVTDGSFTGDAAWIWMKANVNNQNSLNNSPKWAILPRTLIAPTRVGSAAASGKVSVSGSAAIK